MNGTLKSVFRMAGLTAWLVWTSVGSRGAEPFASDYAGIAVAGNFNGWNPGANHLMRYDDYRWVGQFRLIADDFSDPGAPAREMKFAADSGWAVNWGETNQAAFALPLSGAAERGGGNVVFDALNPASSTLWRFLRVFFDERTGEYDVRGIDDSGSAFLYGEHFLSGSADVVYETKAHAAYGGTTVVMYPDGALMFGAMNCAVNMVTWEFGTYHPTPAGSNALAVAINDAAVLVVSRPGDAQLTIDRSADRGVTWGAPWSRTFSSAVGEYRLVGRGTQEFLLMVELWQENKIEVYRSGDQGATFSLVLTLSAGADRIYFEDLAQGDSGFYLGYAMEGAASKVTGVAYSPTGSSGSWTQQVLSTSTNALFRELFVSPTVASLAVLYDKQASEYVIHRRVAGAWTEIRRIRYGWEARDVSLGEENGVQYLVIEDAYISPHFANPVHVWRSTDGGDTWIPYDLVNPYDVLFSGQHVYFLSGYQWFIVKDAYWLGSEPANHPRETFRPSAGGLDPSHAPWFRAATVGAGAANLGMTGLVAGVSYAARHGSGSGDWTTFSNFVAQGNSTSLLHAVSGPVRFYRVEGLPGGAGRMDFQLIVESWPSRALLGATAHFTTDNWATSQSMDLPFLETVGENDAWSAVLGSFTPGQTVRYFVTGEGRVCNTFRFPVSGDFSATVPAP